MSEIATRLEAVQAAIAEAAQRAGRAIDEVELVAVSKTHPPEAVREAFAAGQTLFGESRVQEARAKIPLSPSLARWHFIGHLQKNKIRHALPLFEVFHSVDDLDCAREIDRLATELGLFPRVLLELNVAGESSKFGFSAANLREQMPQLLELQRLQIDGLMTITPWTEKAEGARPFFRELRQLRDDLQREFALHLPQLSMGMSQDYSVAIEEGATMVRVGTGIFGRRLSAAKRRTELPPVD